MSATGKIFEDYSNDTLQEMIPLQDEFMKLYDISGYENWFYDHGVGAFQFKSDDGRSLYFRYVDVGSFSTKKNTWNWSWDNLTTPALVSKRLTKVKTFGTENNFEQLTTGLFEGDEYTGWALTAISAKLLSAIGMYRVPSEHLFIYFIFTNELTQDEFDALKDKTVECQTHQADRVAFVCNHLVKNDNLGFNEAFESDPEFELEEDDEYQAWCDECEKARLATDGWNDESMALANIKVVCESCYFEIKERNQLP